MNAPDDRCLQQTTAAFLASGRVCGTVSAIAVVVASVRLAACPGDSMYSSWGFWGVAVSGLASAWYAFRVRFDEEVFRGLIPDHDFDAALVALGLARTPPADGRSLLERCRGARRLVAIIAALAAIQIVATLLLLLPICQL